MLSKHAELVKALADVKAAQAANIAAAEAALMEHKKLMASTIASLQEQLDLAKAEATESVVPVPPSPQVALQIPPAAVA